MSSILLCATPVHGHVTPILAVAAYLVDAGHDVRVLTGARFENLVTQTGAEWLPLPPEADFDDRDLNSAFPGRVGLTGLASIRWDIGNIFLAPALAQRDAVDAAIAERPVDVLMAEGMFVGASLLLARGGDRPAVVYLGIIPLGLPAPHLAPYGLGLHPKDGVLGRLRNKMLTAFTDKVVFGPLAKDIAAMSREAGIPPETTTGMTWADAADAIAQFTVPSFEYPRDDADVHFIGPLSRTRTTATPEPSWWSDLDGSRPIVHVTQGTIANTDWSELIDPAIEALAHEDVLVVISTGGRPIDPKRVFPSNVRIAEFLPYETLLSRTNVYVTNGGYGGVHYALEHGLPIVSAGRTEDKAEVNARISWAGVGIDLKTNKPTPDAIRRAVRTVLGDPKYAQSSAAIGADIRASVGMAGLDEITSTLLADTATR